MRTWNHMLLAEKLAADETAGATERAARHVRVLTRTPGSR